MTRRALATALVALGMLAPSLAGAMFKPAEETWVSLFDGKTLSGWTTADGTTGKWEVVDGEIHGSGPASHLFSPRGDYVNFKYKADFKIADKANSGMYFRTKPRRRDSPSRLRGPGQQHPLRPGQDRLALQPRQGPRQMLVAARHLVHPGGRGRTAATSSSRSTARPSVDYVDEKNTPVQDRPLRLPAARPGQHRSGSGKSRSWSCPTPPRPRSGPSCTKTVRPS